MIRHIALGALLASALGWSAGAHAQATKNCIAQAAVGQGGVATVTLYDDGVANYQFDLPISDIQLQGLTAAPGPGPRLRFGFGLDKAGEFTGFSGGVDITDLTPTVGGKAVSGWRQEFAFGSEKDSNSPINMHEAYDAPYFTHLGVAMDADRAAPVWKQLQSGAVFTSRATSVGDPGATVTVRVDLTPLRAWTGTMAAALKSLRVDATRGACKVA